MGRNGHGAAWFGLVKFCPLSKKSSFPSPSLPLLMPCGWVSLDVGSGGESIGAFATTPFLSSLPGSLTTWVIYNICEWKSARVRESVVYVGDEGGVHV